MEELLKELGYTNEQIKAILDGMKEKKIFTSGEENIDLRFSKLNDDFNAKDAELTKANDLIKQLQAGTKGNEDLQKKVSDYEKEISNLKAEQTEKDLNNALRFELLKNKAKADDIDYLIFKLQNNKDQKLELDEKGNLKDFKIDDFKKQYKGNFEDDSKTLVDVKKLGGKEQEPGGTKEPETMLDALKEKYMNENEM